MLTFPQPVTLLVPLDETQDEPERRKRVKVAVAGAVSLEVKPVV